MNIEERFDIFEPGDLTALVSVDHPEYQQVVIEQLRSLDYKIHVGLFAEDVNLKLQTTSYDVIVIYENFNDSSLETNPVLQATVNLPSHQRHNQFVVLIGPSLATNDEMLAFVYSVDLVFNVNDLTYLKSVLRKSAARSKDFFHSYNECLHTAGLGR